jgi:hypothetical protein
MKNGDDKHAISVWRKVESVRKARYQRTSHNVVHPWKVKWAPRDAIQN